MPKGERSTEDSASSIRLPALSPTAAAFVRQQPGHAQLAIIAAIEAAAVQFESLIRSKELASPEFLRPYLVERSTGILPLGIIDPEEAARRLEVSRATVYNWIEGGRLIGWRLTGQGTQIPAEQIVGPGELIAGIDRVLQVIPEPRAAWRFLDEESQHLDVPQRPIDALKAGKLNVVITAAQASGESFT